MRGRKGHHQSSRGPTQRQLRVGELVRHQLSTIFMRETFRDPALDGVSITVSEARVSPDLRHAKVFCAPLGGVHQDEVIEALNRSTGYLRHLLGEAITLKHTPELVFVPDESFDEASRINALLASDRVAGDLARPDEYEDDADDGDAGNGAGA